MEPAQTSTSQRLVRRIGQAIAILALLYLGRELYQQWGGIQSWRPTAQQAIAVAAAALCYGVAQILLAQNWVTILQALSDASLPRGPVFLSHTRSQIAKYLPGNVLHVVGRHLYVKKLGVPHGVVARAAVLELASLPTAAVLAVGVAVPFAGGIAGQLPLPPSLLTLLVLLMMLVGSMLLRWRLPALTGPASLVIFRAFLFMLALGAIFALLLWAVSGAFVFDAIPAAILAWLVGFLTPGAPGGLAVREAALITLLATVMGDADALLISALLFRLVTTLGDLLLYLIGNLFVADEGAAES